MKAIMILIGIVAAVIALGWAGLKFKPSLYPAYPKQQAELEYVPLPTELPAPVEKFYRATYGETVPVIKTVVLDGRGDMRFAGVFVPIRFRFAHEVGQNYRHDIELNFLGLPFFKGFDTFIDGRGWANTPGFAAGEGFDQGSNVSLWVEALNWFPAVLVTDPRVEWKEVDNSTALLTVPFGSARETLIVRFDPESGKVQYVEAMKFKSTAGRKVLWVNSIWADEGKPWIHLNVEKTAYNVEVQDYIRENLP